ncbi:TPA: hypothetical protein RTT83_000668 [Staphylococcus aureus]|nr:hypothetical protein [Staphylococcus aureus]
MQVGERGPNTEAGGKSAYNNVQVGERGPNTEAGGKSAYNNVQVGGAPKKDDSKFIVVTTSSIMTPLLLL